MNRLTLFHLPGHHQVKVIRHQHVPMHLYLALIGVVIDQAQEAIPVLVAIKDRLSIILSLRDVQRLMRRRESWFSGHSLISVFRRLFLSFICKKVNRGQSRSDTIFSE